MTFKKLTKEQIQNTSIWVFMYIYALTHKTTRNAAFCEIYLEEMWHALYEQKQVKNHITEDLVFFEKIADLEAFVYYTLTKTQMRMNIEGKVEIERQLISIPSYTPDPKLNTFLLERKTKRGKNTSSKNCNFDVISGYSPKRIQLFIELEEDSSDNGDNGDGDDGYLETQDNLSSQVKA